MSSEKYTFDNEKEKKGIRSPKDDREAKIILAIGKKRVGKTHETNRLMMEEYTLRRKMLIFDTNGEFSHVTPLHFNQLKAFMAQSKIEARRLMPTDPITNLPLGSQGKLDLLKRILDEVKPRKMGLLLEDINSYFTAASSSEMISLLTTNAHYSLDVFIHMQSFRAAPPRIWGNVSIVRLHKTHDSPEQVKEKITNLQLSQIAEIIVNNRYRGVRDRDKSTPENTVWIIAPDPRFFLYIDYDENIVHGNFTRKDIQMACEEYVDIHYPPKRLSSYMRRNKIKDKDRAIFEMAEELVIEYTKKK